MTNYALVKEVSLSFAFIFFNCLDLWRCKR